MISVSTLQSAAKAMELNEDETKQLIRDRKLWWTKNLEDKDAADLCEGFIDEALQQIHEEFYWSSNDYQKNRAEQLWNGRMEKLGLWAACEGFIEYGPGAIGWRHQ